MGTLADCLEKSGLTGNKAEMVKGKIDKKAADYKEMGYGAQEAYVRAAKDVHVEARDYRKAVMQQVKDLLGEDQQEEAFSPAPPISKQEEAPVEEAAVENPPAEGPAAEEESGTATQGKPMKPAKKRQQKVVKTGLKGVRSIINSLQKALQIPIRYGQSKHPKFGGYFAPIPNLIVSKYANDIPVVTHEVGHKLDQMFQLRKDPAISAELDKLGDPSQSPGSRSSWKPGMSRDYKMGEGVAEFLRYWFTSPTHAKREAPQLYDKWEAILDEHKDLSDTMRQAKRDIEAWKKADPVARQRSSIVSGGNPNGSRMTLDQLTHDLVDEVHYGRLLQEHKVRQGGDASPSKNTYMLMRLLKGAPGRVHTLISRGMENAKTGEVTLGTSYMDALKPVAHRLDDFRSYIVAKRAVELHKRGIETGLVKHDQDLIVKQFDNEPGFQQAFADLKKWADGILQYAIDKGSITPKMAKRIRALNKDYVPFHRMFEIGANESPVESSGGSGRGMIAGTPTSLRAIGGSRRDIIDPLESYVSNALSIITAADKHEILNTIAASVNQPDMGRWVRDVGRKSVPHKVTTEQLKKQLEALGADLDGVDEDDLQEQLVYFSKATQPDYGTNTIRVVDNQGGVKFYQLDGGLYSTVKNLDHEEVGRVTKALAPFANLLRSGVALDVGFMAANVWRDAWGAAILGKGREVPFASFIRGAQAMANDPKLRAEFAAAGGMGSSEFNLYDPKETARWIKTKIGKDLTLAEKAMIMNPLKALRIVAAWSEEATRLGQYKADYEKYIKQGMPEIDARRQAAFDARDRQDFNKGGAKTKSLRMMAAFWNAGLQSNVKIKHAFQERPLETTMRSLLFITLPTLLEQALNHDDEDYWERPRWERLAFWMIPFGKDESGHTRFFRLPKPFLLGQVFGNGPAAIIEAMKEKEPDALKEWATATLRENTPNPTPQWLLAGVENVLPQGFSFFRWKPIVPDSLADAPADLQYTQLTSSTAKKVGEMFGISPLKVDHFIESTTGGLGKTLTGRSAPWDRFLSKPMNVSGQSLEDFYGIRRELTEEAKREDITGEVSGMGPVMRSPVEKAAAQMAAYRDKAQKAEAEGDTATAAAANEKRYKIARDVSEAYDPDSDTPGAVADYAVKKAKLGLLSSGKPKAASAVATLEERMAEFTAEREAALDWMVEHRDEPSVKKAIEDFLRSDDYLEAVGIIKPPRRQKGQNNAEWAATQAQYKRRVERREWAKKAAAKLRQ